MSQRRENDKKKKKKQQSQIEAMIFRMMEQSMKSALDTAMKELFQDWKWFNGEGFHWCGTLAVIVVYSRRGLSWLHRQQPQKPSFKIKITLGWAVSHIYTLCGEQIFCFPKWVPPSAKGSAQFPEQNPGIFPSASWLLEPIKTVQESICFTGHPP